MNNDWMKDVTYDMLSESQKRIADVIGVKPTLQLCAEWGGGYTLYVPKNDDVLRTMRDDRIKQAYTGGNSKVRSLTKQYGLSDRRIRQLIKEVRPRQMKIDEFE